MKLGQHVKVQNQRSAGNLAKKWDRTGVVVECPGYDKYTIRMDGSGNVMDRNRSYLRTFTPDHTINPPSLQRPCMELPRRMETTVPSPLRRPHPQHLKKITSQRLRRCRRTQT